MTQANHRPRISIVGAGPAGLMAAQVLSQAGCCVQVFDAMPSVGRKFLRAGIGGLNLTHAEPMTQFMTRYGAQAEKLSPMLESFGPEAIRQWAEDLGTETFIGSSNRVFPVDMKAAPLLRAWLHRLREQGVMLHSRHRWTGWSPEGQLTFEHENQLKIVESDANLLALGGGSWPQLGSNAAWIPLLESLGASITPLAPSNCGFEVSAWSEHLQNHFAGAPIKGVTLSQLEGAARKGECILTQTGLEGSLIYALSADIRREIQQQGHAELWMDLLPERSLDQVITLLSKPRGSRSLSNHLKRQLGLEGIKAALLREQLTSSLTQLPPEALAQAIKKLPITLVRPRPLAEAISTAGGLSFSALDEHLMLRQKPGTFCAGEMLDWDAPTGGYLLTACFSTGHWAAQGILKHLKYEALSGDDNHMRGLN